MKVFDPRRLLAMTWARSLEFLRDRATLGWNLGFPILMLIGFAWIFSGPGQPMFKVAVLLPADVALDAKAHPFLAAPAVQFYREADLASARAKVERHRIDLAVDLTATPPVYLVNPASQKGAVLDDVVRGAGGVPLVRVPVSGAGFRYVDWAAPGILGLNLMFSCLFGTGYVIVRYRKSGYLKRLSATPLTATEFIVAQLLSRLAIVLFVVTVLFTGARLLLHLRMDGSYLLLFVLTAIGAYSMIAMGLVVSARVTSEELAGGILNLLTWPMMVLSGVFFSLDGTPRPVQIASEFFPLTHMLNAARAIMLDGAGLASAEVLHPLLVLSALSAVFTVLGATGFKWTQD